MSIFPHLAVRGLAVSLSSPAGTCREGESLYAPKVARKSATRSTTVWLNDQPRSRLVRTGLDSLAVQKSTLRRGVINPAAAFLFEGIIGGAGLMRNRIWPG
jgi:hypothetical protein